MGLGTVGTLLPVTRSQSDTSDPSPSLASYPVAGAVLEGLGHCSFVLDPAVIGVGALVLYAVLPRTRIVPIWLSLWGVAGGFLVFVAGVVGLVDPFPTRSRGADRAPGDGLRRLAPLRWVCPGGSVSRPGSPGGAAAPKYSCRCQST